MTIELTILLSVISVLAAALFGFANYRRTISKDCAEEASQSAKIMTKLEEIDKGITDIKEEIKGVKADVKDDHDRIIRLEESAKQAHKRIDGIERSWTADSIES